MEALRDAQRCRVSGLSCESTSAPRPTSVSAGPSRSSLSVTSPLAVLTRTCAIIPPRRSLPRPLTGTVHFGEVLQLHARRGRDAGVRRHLPAECTLQVRLEERCQLGMAIDGAGGVEPR